MRLGASLRTPLVALFLMLTACPDPGVGDPDSEVTGPSGGGDASTSGTGAAATSVAVTTDPSSTTYLESTGDPGGTSEGSGATTTTTGDATDTEDPTGTTSTTGVDPPAACRKVDLLFVIDKSEHIVDAWPQLDQLGDHLIGRLNGDLADWDYHIMVIDADAQWGWKACEERCALGEDCEDIAPGYPCDYEPGMCDTTLGAGIRVHAGKYSSNKDCGMIDGRRYIAPDQPNLYSTLKCLLDVGLSGGGFGSRLMQAIINATDTPLNGPGGCNEGFLRDDAFLLTMVVNTLPDNNSPGDPPLWHKEVLASKGGNFDKVFMIGMINDGFWHNICGDWSDSGNTQMVEDFVNLFFRRELSSLCVKDYRPSLDKALDYVETACKGKP